MTHSEYRLKICQKNYNFKVIEAYSRLGLNTEGRVSHSQRKSWKFMESMLIHVCIQSYVETRRKCKFPINSTRSVFGLSLIHHGSGAVVYMYILPLALLSCVYSTLLLQLWQSGPFLSRYTRFLFLPDAKKPRRINLAKFSREQTGSQTPLEHHNIWLLVHNNIAGFLGLATPAVRQCCTVVRSKGSRWVLTDEGAPS